MKQFMKIGIMIILIGLYYTSSGLANPSEWHNMPVSGNDQGDLFQIRFEIKSDETTNYTITIQPGDQFSLVDGNLTMTKNIPINATRTYIFNMKLDNDVEDGKHPIPYTASKDGSSFKSGNVYVRAGTQTPGFEMVVFLAGILFSFFFICRRQRN